MRFLALAVLAAALPFAAAAEDRTDLNMVVSLDRSESVNAEEAIAQIQGLIHALTHERFIGAIQSGAQGRIGFAVVKWSSFNRSEVILPWTVIADLEDAEAVSTRLYTAMKKRRLLPDGTQTDLAFGIEVATAMLDAAPYRATRDVINIVGDGLSNIGRLPSVDRDIALSRGITINALIMAKGRAVPVLTRYFEREVIGGPLAFVHHATNVAEFAMAMLRKMVLEMARFQAMDAPRPL